MAGSTNFLTSSCPSGNARIQEPFRPADYVSEPLPEASWALGLHLPGNGLVPSMQKYAARPDLGVAEARVSTRPVPTQMVAVWWLLLERSFHLAENKKP